MATTVRPTSISGTQSAYTGGSWSPYGFISPAQGADLLHQSVQWNTEEAIRKAQLERLQLGIAGGASSISGGYRGGGYGGGGGSASSLGPTVISPATISAYKNLMEQYTQGYKGLAKQTKKRYGKMMETVEGVTSQREADIRRGYAGRESDIMQNLARLGMANTTVAPTLGMGVQREQGEALNRLADALLGTKLGVMGGRTGELTRLGEAGLAGRLGIMERLAGLGVGV